VNSTGISGIIRGNDRASRQLRLGMILSAALHLLLLVAGIVVFRHPLSTQIVAAGEGQGGAGGAIEVGVVDAGQLGFAKPRAVSHLGEEADAANNTLVETRPDAPPPDAEALPSSADKPKAREKTATTERPTARQSEQLFSKKPLQGRSADTHVEVGRSYGSPTPQMSGGIGIGAGGSGAGHGTGGVPGGSEYGRRIQMILGRNYNPPAIADVSGTHYVIIQLRIARDGRILSLTSGRVAASYIKQASRYDLVNRAAERAILASDPLPPFPVGFLAGAQEAMAEIWFRYPK
jgi:outer membrane biosynthesis protein TonB